MASTMSNDTILSAKAGDGYTKAGDSYIKAGDSYTKAGNCYELMAASNTSTKQTSKKNLNSSGDGEDRFFRILCSLPREVRLMILRHTKIIPWKRSWTSTNYGHIGILKGKLHLPWQDGIAECLKLDVTKIGSQYRPFVDDIFYLFFKHNRFMFSCKNVLPSDALLPPEGFLTKYKSYLHLLHKVTFHFDPATVKLWVKDKAAVMPGQPSAVLCRQENRPNTLEMTQTQQNSLEEVVRYLGQFVYLSWVKVIFEIYPKKGTLDPWPGFKEISCRSGPEECMWNTIQEMLQELSEVPN